MDSKNRRRNSTRSRPRLARGHRRPPDLSGVLLALRNAQALVTVAHAVMASGKAYGPEESVLRLGVDALRKVYKWLDETDVQLTRFHNRNISTSRGAV